jgi:hypothetical protein
MARIIDDYHIKRMRSNMKRIDKMIMGLDTELIIYTIDRIAVELDIRAREIERKHNDRLQKEIPAKTKEA